MTKDNPPPRAPGKAGILVVTALLVPMPLLVIAFVANTGAEAETEQRIRELTRVGDRLQYLDEVLTMSARMYAATNDTTWKQRYLDSEGPLNETLERGLRAAHDSSYLVDLQRVADANSALVDAEKRAFVMTEQGAGAQAVLLLNGPEYRQQKAIYWAGNEHALLNAQTRLGAYENTLEARLMSFGVGLAILAMIVIALAIYLAVAFARARRRQILGQAFRDLAVERELNAFKTNLLNTASHELNTPIAALKLQLHLLHGQPLGPLGAQAATVLERNVSRLATLVADTLDVSRIQAGKLVLNPANVPWQPILDDLQATYQPVADAAGVSLRFQEADAEAVYADAGRVTQVLHNLVSNAIKFTPRGGAVDVTQRRDGDGFLVEVRDTGLGLSAPQISKLFQPFSRVHDSTLTSAKGTGLGLYISREIVAQHGGRIWCASDGPGGGCCFSFTLPVAGMQPTPTPTLPTGLVAPETPAVTNS